MISSVSSEEFSRDSFAEVTPSRGLCALPIKISLQFGIGIRDEVPNGLVLNQSPGRIVKGNLANLLIVSTASCELSLDPAASFSLSWL